MIHEAVVLITDFIICWLVDKRSKYQKCTLRWIFSAFLVLYITVLRRDPQEREVRLIPFQIFTLRTLYTDFLNIILFVPLGYETQKMNKRKSCIQKLKRSLIFGFVLSLLVESLQLVFERGTCDAEDLIFNTIGALLGGILYELLNRNFSVEK